MTETSKTPRQIAEEQIKEELGINFICFGTFVSNREMANIVLHYLNEQKKAQEPKTERPAACISSWTRAVRFKYNGNTYFCEMVEGVSKVYLFNGNTVGTEVLFEEHTSPVRCKDDFIRYMEGDWE